MSTTAVFSRTDQSKLSQWWWTVDKTMLLLIGILSLIGIVMVATASPSVAERIDLPTYHFLSKHVLFLAMALAGMLTLSFMEEKNVWRLSALGFALSVLAMIMTLFIGFETKGGQRWLLIGGYQLQPSEFLKPSFLVVSAWLLAQIKDAPPQTAKFLRLANWGLLAFCLVLLIAQPDLGMTVLLSVSFGAQLFLSGLPLRRVFILGGAVTALLAVSYLTLDHVQSRIDRFIDPSSGDTFQVDRSLESFANGGLIGAGPGQGTVKRQLPDAHADFIFAVAGEEFGLLLTFGVIALYAFMLLHGMRRLIDQGRLFAMLAGGALLAMIALQSMIHMGSAMQIIPAKGMTLPFISYGGSSTLAMGYTFGVLLALTKRRPDESRKYTAF